MPVFCHWRSNLGKVHEWSDLDPAELPNAALMAGHAAPSLPSPDLANPVVEEINNASGRGQSHRPNSSSAQPNSFVSAYRRVFDQNRGVFGTKPKTAVAAAGSGGSGLFVKSAQASPEIKAENKTLRLVSPSPKLEQKKTLTNSPNKTVDSPNLMSGTRFSWNRNISRSKKDQQPVEPQKGETPKLRFAPEAASPKSPVAPLRRQPSTATSDVETFPKQTSQQQFVSKSASFSPPEPRNPESPSKISMFQKIARPAAVQSPGQTGKPAVAPLISPAAEPAARHVPSKLQTSQEQQKVSFEQQENLSRKDDTPLHNTSGLMLKSSPALSRRPLHAASSVPSPTYQRKFHEMQPPQTIAKSAGVPEFSQPASSPLLSRKTMPDPAASSSSPSMARRIPLSAANRNIISFFEQKQNNIDNMRRPFMKSEGNLFKPKFPTDSMTDFSPAPLRPAESLRTPYLLESKPNQTKAAAAAADILPNKFKMAAAAISTDRGLDKSVAFPSSIQSTSMVARTKALFEEPRGKENYVPLTKSCTFSSFPTEFGGGRSIVVPGEMSSSSHFSTPCPPRRTSSKKVLADYQGNIVVLIIC